MRSVKMSRLPNQSKAGLTWLVMILMAFALPKFARAQSLDDDGGAVEVTDSPAPTQYPTKGAKVGRKAAEKYMGQKSPADSSQSRSIASAGSNSAHYLALDFGFFFSDNAYKWGAPDAQSNVGRWNFGVTYRVGEWVNSMDLGVRVDLQSYQLNEGSATKLSFMPVVMFPDASSRFPLYFGAGAGLGVFTQQLNSKSPLSLDYQLFGGIRFFNVLKSTGFFAEAGLKNHFLLLSDGQYNGTYFALGTVFSF